MLKFIKIMFSAFSKVVIFPMVILDIFYRIERSRMPKQDSLDEEKSDWNKVGNDMWRAILKYDRKVTQEDKQ